MRRLALFLLLFPVVVLAQNESWTDYPDTGCIGGTCTDRRMRVELDDRAVLAVRFRAHDNIGNTRDGLIRVKIDGHTVKGRIAIPRNGETFTIQVDELSGRYIVFEPENDDEVEISDIQVLYGRDAIRRRDPYRGDGGRPGGGSGGGWRSYREGGCIGGDQCRKNGNRITVALEDRPVLGIRFFAHDNFGSRANGKLWVRIDGATIGWQLDVLRDGKRHDVEVDNVRGQRLVIETATDDEVEIRELEVLYGRGSRRGGGNWQREVTHEGGCIGGNTCGGRRARIRIPIYGRTVASIRFNARDDVGSRAEGELRIRVDNEVVQDYLAIKRDDRGYSFDGRGLAGDFVYFETTTDDEVVIRDIQITFVDE